MGKRKFILFIAAVAAVFTMMGAYAVMGDSFSIEKFSVSPENPEVNQKITFRVKMKGSVKRVYMTIDSDKEIDFEKKTTNTWEAERKLTIEGTRKIKVTAQGFNGESDSIKEIIEVKAKENTQEEESVTETTTERVFTGNVTKEENDAESTEEESTEENENVNFSGGEDFDGGEYTGEDDSDEYYELSKSENMEALDKAAENSIFLFIGEPTFIKGWSKEAIDPDNPQAASFINGGYTMVALRAIAEGFGAATEWDANTKTAHITLSGKKISVTAGSSDIVSESGKTDAGAAAVIKDGRVFVPLRGIAEGFGKKVYYTDKFVGISDANISEGGLELIRLAAVKRFYQGD